MKYIIPVCVVLIGTLWHTNLLTSEVSMVYNYRIAQVTTQSISQSNHKNHTIVALLFDLYQKKYNNQTRQNFAGGLGSFIYDFDPCYFRIDFAACHVHETVNHKTTLSDTQTDDILFTLGGSVMKNTNTTIALSGLFGIPTHKIFTLQHLDFGYAQVSTGIQVDGTHILNGTGSSAEWGARYIYFIPRTAQDNLCNNHNFSIGNIIDLLFAYKKDWLKHGLELGYTARFDFGAFSHPKFDDIVESVQYNRSTFYGVYEYKFSINDMASRLLFNISYGFDTSPKTFGNKNIVTLWAAWDLNF